MCRVMKGLKKQSMDQDSHNSAVIHCETEAQVSAACALLQHMYPDRDASYVEESVAEMLEEGWKLIAIFGDDGACHATIMYRMGRRLFCSKYLQLESLYVNPDYRRAGYAKTLFDFLEAKARQENCQMLLLESLVENFPGHKFFFKQGYFIRGYVVTKPLEE